MTCSKQPQEGGDAQLDLAADLLPDNLAENGLSPENRERMRTIIGPWPYFTYPGNSENYPDNFAAYGADSIKSDLDFEFKEDQPAPGTPNRIKQNRVLDSCPQPEQLRRFHDRLLDVTRNLFKQTRIGLSPELWEKYTKDFSPELKETADQLRVRNVADRPKWQDVAALFRRELYAEMDCVAGGKELYIAGLLKLIQIDNQNNRSSCDLVSGAAGRYCDVDYTTTALCSGLSEEMKSFGIEPIDEEMLFAGVPQARPYERNRN